MPYPVEKIKRKVFESLPDYSCSFPTGTKIGKVWKRRKNYYDESKGWLICEYISDPNPNIVGISYREVEIIDD